MSIKNVQAKEKAIAEVKRQCKTLLTDLLSILITYAIFGFLVSLLYNYIAPIWALPKLEYMQALALLLLIKIISFMLYNGKR